MSNDHDIAIIGAGAAGMTAGIYAGRSGMKAIVLEARSIGGLSLTSPEIENYPGFSRISGPELMAEFQGHAERWCELRDIEPVNGLKVREDGVTVVTSEATYDVGAVILCMGADHRKLGVPGEEELAGKGVSYCATCDGVFFKDRKVVQVGGGNTAALEALYLNGLGADVTLVHRRDRLRAEADYGKRMEDAGIPVVWNTVVKEIRGTGKVTSVVLEDQGGGARSQMDVDGVFIAVGMIPNNGLALDIGVEVDRAGFIKVNKRMETNVKRVYAAGDITGGIRQIVHACAEGATAALSSLEAVGKAYPF